MSDGINIFREFRQGVNIIRVKNQILLDPSLADEMTAVLSAAFEAGDQKVLLDIQAVTRMSSLFFRSFIIAGKKAKTKKAVMAFCNVSPTIKGGFEMMGLTSYFQLFEKESLALDALK
jgi:anti-anti-sigma factor